MIEVLSIALLRILNIRVAGYLTSFVQPVVPDILDEENK